MHRIPTAALVLLLAGMGAAQAQVHRCGGSKLYTDRPCHGATAVDVRPNLLDAGTRQIPADPPPAPAVIPPGNWDVPKPSESSSGSVWDRRDADDSGFRSRTAPVRP